MHSLKNFIWAFVSILLTTISACTSDNSIDSEQVHKDVPNIPISFRVRRMDVDLYKTKEPANNFSVGVAKVKQSYRGLFDIYLEGITQLASAQNATVYEPALQNFLTDKYINELFVDVQKTYPNLQDVEHEFADAFKFYKQTFPKASIPDVVTIVSGFQVANAIADSALFVGLDLFLGRTYKNYPNVNFLHTYQYHRLSKEYIVPNSMYLLAQDAVGDPPLENSNLLQYMIHYGKIAYLTKTFLPNTPDSLLTGYTRAQTKWCKESESSIWAYLVENGLLYKNDQANVSKFLNDGPFTVGLPKESPARLGRWIGWRIVDAYMRKHPETTIEQLIANHDGQKILNESKYKPKTGL